MRPVLSPAARRLWRDPVTLQLGRHPGSQVLCGIDPATRHTLALLDGTRDLEQVRVAAASAGCPQERTDHLLALLRRAGLLDDAGGERTALATVSALERDRLTADVGSLALVRGDGGLPAAGHRRQARVVVLGGGRVGAPLAALLAAAGLGAVDVVDDSTARPEDTGVGGLALVDVGRARGAAARDRLREAWPSSQAAALTHAQLVVIAPSRSEQLEAFAELVPPGLPHLVAQVRDTVGVVGPMVLPGRTSCLRCAELTRTDLDPGWPALSAQLASPSRHREPCDGPLAVMVAAQAAMQVLMLVDGTADPASLGGTLELALPDWRWRRRTWPMHPGCGCAC